MAERRMCECKKRGCYELTRNKSGYCDKHEPEYIAKVNRQKDEWKKKNGYRPPNKHYTKIDKFYGSKQWQELRSAVLARDHYICQECLKHNMITRATQVHHIVTVLNDWNARFHSDNLVSLCNKCHIEVYHHGKTWEEAHGDE